MCNNCKDSKYKPIIKKKKKKHDEIALLAKTNINCIKGSNSSSVADSYIERNYILLRNVLSEYDNIKKSIS